MTVFHGKTHYKLPFSIAMLNCQRVCNELTVDCNLPNQWGLLWEPTSWMISNWCHVVNFLNIKRSWKQSQWLTMTGGHFASSQISVYSVYHGVPDFVKPNLGICRDTCWLNLPHFEVLSAGDLLKQGAGHLRGPSLLSLFKHFTGGTTKRWKTKL